MRQQNLWHKCAGPLSWLVCHLLMDHIFDKDSFAIIMTPKKLKVFEIWQFFLISPQSLHHSEEWWYCASYESDFCSKTRLNFSFKKWQHFNGTNIMTPLSSKWCQKCFWSHHHAFKDLSEDPYVLMRDYGGPILLCDVLLIG